MRVIEESPSSFPRPVWSVQELDSHTEIIRQSGLLLAAESSPSLCVTSNLHISI
ncbi:hypothetical protein DPMN_050694 [Dreissena polymorpha]|uniref:Uncharacterized protein n=1 Tax=Dreissena polymorpha TaxID=45954 RepID=A0A9D4CI16_DREPO|nr:hypothetical protein DPMN_050694 [Dreissena polymorpha]